MIDKFTEWRIKQSADIYRVFCFYGLELKKVGSTYFTRCPFHGDNNPSMSIDTKTQCWRCWVCSELEPDEKHDHIGFVMKYEGISYPQALERLAQIYGIVIPESGQLPGQWTPPTPIEIPERPEPEPTYTDPAVMHATMRDYDSNPLFIFLSSLFDPNSVKQAFTRYNVGTAKHTINPEQQQRRSTVFWQVDASGRVHGGKIVAYSEQTGKRIKSASGLPVQWVHKIKKLGFTDNYNLKQCLFGAHLITDKTERVNIVESEKTALLASLYYGDASGVWAATGGKTSSTLNRVLDAVPNDSTQIVLYPDADAVSNWLQLCADLKEIGLNAEISNIMDNEPGGSKADIGDFIIEAVTGIRTTHGRVQLSAPPTAPEPEPDFVSINEMRWSVQRCERSNYFAYLSSIFDPNSVKETFTRYNVGHDYDLDNCTAFWQVDASGRVRVAKIASHDPHTGKRVRNPDWCVREDGTCWHFDLPLWYVKYNLKQCLFGAHLIRSASRVNIVAAEETALLGHLIFGELYGTWAATGTTDPEQSAKLISEAAHILNGKEVHFYTEGAAEEDYMQLCAHLQSMGVTVNLTEECADWAEAMLPGAFCPLPTEEPEQLQPEHFQVSTYAPGNPDWVLNPIIDHGGEMPF